MNVDRSPKAVLLLGPTGSGKTPLGNLLEARGLRNAACRHFDFGAQLRAIVLRDQPDSLFSRPDIDFLRAVLQQGALLENEHFSIAERILRSFLAQPETAGRIVVLNGLPRHLGQAHAVDKLLSVETVLSLHCSAEVVLKRIQTNVGGDRTGRPDDDLASIHKKLFLFDQRTAPLLEHYRAQGARILPIEVAADMTPDAMWQLLA